MNRLLILAMLPMVVLLSSIFACSSGSAEATFYIGGIPDQDLSLLQSRFDNLAEYLSEKTGINVRYVSSVSYEAVVTGFRHGDIQMAWYGGLTGVQAREAVPGAMAIAQRPEDEKFQSVFISRKELDIQSLDDLEGMSITFGSESSTSGHLMPRFFLMEAGINPEEDLGFVSYSGSHDLTWKLVEAGSFDVGALNAMVWSQRVKAGVVDTSKVEVFFTTPHYSDYHWVIRGDVDQRFGKGATEKFKQALLNLNASDGGKGLIIMEAFQTDRFITTSNDNYKRIEDAARQMGIIKE